MKGLLAEDKYYRRFGLDGDPFPLESIDQVMFLTPELERRLDIIRELVNEEWQLQLVTAPLGGGKSQLSLQLRETAPENWFTARIQAHNKMHDRSLACEFIKQAFPEIQCNPDNAVDELHNVLEYANRNNGIPVFIIDDAHRLPAGTFDFIFQLVKLRYTKTAFYFILFAEESINDRFEDPTVMVFPEGNIRTLHLPPLTETQTAEYIQHRLLSYGHIKKDPFDDETIADIHHASGGLPGGIHFLARRTMQGNPASRPHGGGVLLGTFVLLVFVFLAIFMLPPKHLPELAQGIAVLMPEQDGGAVAMPVEIDKTSNQTREDRPSDRVAETKERIPPAPDQAEPETSLEPVTVAVARRPEIKQPQTVEPGGDATKDDADGMIATAAAEPITPLQQGETAEPEQESVEETEEAIAPSQSASSPLTEPEESATAQEETRIAATGPSPGNSTVFDLRNVPAWAGDIKGEDWLREQSEDAVLLQLISASELENVEKLFRGLPEVPDPFSGFTNYTPSGKPRYRLYYGLYPDTDSAAEAVAELPAPLRSLQPWPRPLTNIIEELDNKKKRFNENE